MYGQAEEWAKAYAIYSAFREKQNKLWANC